MRGNLCHNAGFQLLSQHYCSGLECFGHELCGHTDTIDCAGCLQIVSFQTGL